MAKLFRIKNKILRYGLSFVVLCIISAICIAAIATIFCGLGYVSHYKLNVEEFSFMYEISAGDGSNKVDVIEGLVWEGFWVFAFLFYSSLGIFGILFLTINGTKGISNILFNSINNKNGKMVASET